MMARMENREPAGEQAGFTAAANMPAAGRP